MQKPVPDLISEIIKLPSVINKANFVNSFSYFLTTVLNDCLCLLENPCLLYYLFINLFFFKINKKLLLLFLLLAKNANLIIFC